MNDEWREVSEDDFFAEMNPKDVHPTIQPGPYPYTSLWRTRDGKAVGKSVGRIDEGTMWLLPKNS